MDGNRQLPIARFLSLIDGREAALKRRLSRIASEAESFPLIGERRRDDSHLREAITDELERLKTIRSRTKLSRRTRGTTHVTVPGPLYTLLCSDEEAV